MGTSRRIFAARRALESFVDARKGNDFETYHLGAARVDWYEDAEPGKRARGTEHIWLAHQLYVRILRRPFTEHDGALHTRALIRLYDTYDLDSLKYDPSHVRHQLQLLRFALIERSTDAAGGRLLVLCANKHDVCTLSDHPFDLDAIVDAQRRRVVTQKGDADA